MGPRAGRRSRMGLATLPRGEAKVAAVEAMFDAIAPRYDLCNRVISLGLDAGWRRRTVGALGLAPGATVLDLACGTGDLCRLLQRASLHAVGIDRSAGMLAAARTDAPMVRGDALRLPLRDATVEGVVCGFALRNFAELPPFFSECARVLRPGGRVALLEVAEPERALLRLGHSLWFGRVVPLVGGLLSDRAAYRYLPQSVAYLPGEAELTGMLTAAGFADVHRQALSGGLTQLITGTRL
jgi:demethylmenaquinone methyltransferase/2-methoxy-6-polyprenyl-1,4-benzoquinol methylase